MQKPKVYYNSERNQEGHPGKYAEPLLGAWRICWSYLLEHRPRRELEEFTGLFTGVSAKGGESHGYIRKGIM